MADSVAFLGSPFAIAVAAVFGAVWGSFFTVCVSRVPRGASVVRPGSRCDACGAPIRARDNVPIVSYLVLHGRCRACGARFSTRHLVIEAVAGALAALLWWRLVTADPTQAIAIRAARFALYFAFSGVLLVLSFIDFDTQLLPDVITLPAIPVLFLAAFGAHDAGWLDRLIGAAAGYAFVRLIADFYYYVLRREGLGLGDGKLLALIGAVLGWKALPFVVFVGATAGAAVSLPFALARRRRMPSNESIRHIQIPFGPFLAAGALAYVLLGRTLLGLLGG